MSINKINGSIKNKIIGIDLGTTYSCVAVWDKGEAHIITNSEGSRITPSYVCLADGMRIVGNIAKEQISSYPKNTVYDVKRLMGIKYSTLYNEQLSYEIVPDENDNPRIKIDDKLYSPEQISAMILSSLKKDAEAFLGYEVKRAIITVPAYFGDAQKQATIDAGQIAGLEVVQLINEPTAGAIAYGLNNKKDKESRVLIFDLGGGTLDVTILTIDNGTFHVKGTSGDTHLGGEDFDNLLMTYCLAEYKKRTGIDLRNILPKEHKLFRTLKASCEEAKKDLSTSMSTNIYLFYDGEDFEIELSRAKLESILTPLIDKLFLPIHDVLTLTKTGKGFIDEVVLIGGSTRMPIISERLKDFFGFVKKGKELNRSINPDEAVAYGACVQGALITKDESIGTDLLLLDVTSLSIGVETAGGRMVEIIPRGKSVPIKIEKVFTTFSDNQPSVKISVYEGERALVKDNTLLGSFEMTGLKPLPRGESRLKVIFSIDAGGVLHVTCRDESTQKSANLTIKSNQNRLTPEEIANMIEDAEKHAQYDKLIKQKTDDKNTLETFVYSLKVQMDKMRHKMLENELLEITKVIMDGINYLESNNDDYSSKFKELEAKIFVYSEKIWREK